jgi:hypothetical protein
MCMCIHVEYLVAMAVHCCYRLQHKRLNWMWALVRYNLVLTRQYFRLVKNIHEIALTNRSKVKR